MSSGPPMRSAAGFPSGPVVDEQSIPLRTRTARVTPFRRALALPIQEPRRLGGRTRGCERAGGAPVARVAEAHVVLAAPVPAALVQAHRLVGARLVRHLELHAPALLLRVRAHQRQPAVAGQAADPRPAAVVLALRHARVGLHPLPLLPLDGLELPRAVGLQVAPAEAPLVLRVLPGVVRQLLRRGTVERASKLRVRSVQEITGEHRDTSDPHKRPVGRQRGCVRREVRKRGAGCWRRRRASTVASTSKQEISLLYQPHCTPTSEKFPCGGESSAVTRGASGRRRTERRRRPRRGHTPSEAEASRAVGLDAGAPACRGTQGNTCTTLSAP